MPFCIIKSLGVYMIIIRIDFTDENMTREEEHEYALSMRDYLLNKYAEFEEAPVFAHYERGKPYIANSDVSYSVSHTKGCIACAVSVPSASLDTSLDGLADESGEYLIEADHPCEIGIDLEFIDRARTRDRIDAIAGRYFSDGERLRLFHARDMSEDFYRIWTAKESLVKCTGEGMRAITRADSADLEGYLIHEFKVIKNDAEYAASVCVKNI